MTGNNFSYRLTECYECGSPVHTNGSRALCEECAAEHQRIANNRRRLYYHIEPDAYVVIKDPTPIEEGGYIPGASFDKECFENMLRPSYQALAPGTILKDREGGIFEIIKGKRGKLELIPA